MYDEKYSKFNNAYLVYIQSRFLRLYPVYWIVLAFTLLCYKLFPALWDVVIHNAGSDFTSLLISNILVVTNGFDHTYWFIVPAWSLAVELQFYIIVPLLLLIVKNKMLSLLLLIISSLLIIIGVYNGWGVFKFESVLTYLPYFVAGGMIYTWGLKASYTSAKISVFAVLGLIAVSHGVPVLREAVLSRDYIVLGFVLRESFNVIIAIAALPFIVYNIHQPVVNRKSDAIASSMSFIIYLFIALAYSSAICSIG